MSPQGNRDSQSRKKFETALPALRVCDHAFVDLSPFLLSIDLFSERSPIRFFPRLSTSKVGFQYFIILKMPEYNGFSTLHIRPMLVWPEFSVDLLSKQKEDSDSGYAHVLVARESFADEGCP
jgi:hypothetical protein